jgi:hypothetical protein
VDGLQAERTTQISPTEELFFDVNAQLEEQKRGSNEVTLNFSLLITTKPNIVKYSTRGIVTLEGPSADVQKKLEANPKTKIPQILFTVYQHVFNSIYILASILNTPYPPPDLLHPMAEKIQILPSTPPEKPQPEQAATPQQPSTSETPASSPQQPAGGQPATGPTPSPAGGNVQTNPNPP